MAECNDDAIMNIKSTKKMENIYNNAITREENAAKRRYQKQLYRKSKALSMNYDHIFKPPTSRHVDTPIRSIQSTNNLQSLHKKKDISLKTPVLQPDRGKLQFLRQFNLSEEDVIICNRLRSGVHPSWYHQYRNENGVTHHVLRSFSLENTETNEEQNSPIDPIQEITNQISNKLQIQEENNNKVNGYRSSSPLSMLSRGEKALKGRYLIREALANGSYGNIHAGEDLFQDFPMSTEKTKVVVKIVPKQVLRSIEERQSVQREKVIHCMLKHPHIIKLYDTFEDKQAHYFVLERAEAGDVSKLRTAKGLSESYVRQLMYQILQALQYLHETMRIVHHDLKPQNLLLVTPDHVKVCDFGASRVMDPVPKGQTSQLEFAGLFGTSGYIAPELLEPNVKWYDSAIDMFSMGVILFELVLGYAPFYPPNSCTNQPLVFSKHDKCTDKVKDLIEKLLERDPKKRYTARQALNHPWFQLL